MRALALVVLAFVLAGCPAKPRPRPPEPQERVGEPDQPPPRTSFDLDGERLVLPAPLVFDSGTNLDVPASADALAYIRDFLEAKPDVTKIRIEGHTDGAGDEPDVMFSGERALNVGNWLIDHGVDCERMIIAGFGGTKPIVDPSTAEGRAQNVRIEVVLVELRSNLIGGMPADGSAPAAVPACPL